MRFLDTNPTNLPSGNHSGRRVFGLVMGDGVDLQYAIVEPVIHT
jgi:hypothetical protein